MPSTVGVLSAASSLKNPAEAKSLGYRVNYIPNPSFEVDLAGWSAVAGASLSRVTSDSHSGSACLRISNTSGSAAQFGTTGAMIPLIGGEGTYQLSAYIKLDPAATTANYWVRHLQYETQTSSSTVGAGNIGTVSLSPSGSWVRVSGSFTKVANANYAIIRVVTGSTTPGDVFFVDSVMLEKSNSLGSYFDGNTNGFWTGDANASFSGATPY